MFRGPTGIFNSRPEYQKYKIENFSSNYYSLQKVIKRRVQMKNKARAAFEHDRSLVDNNHGNSFYYPGSLVEKQLRRDVQQGFTDGKTPSEVFAGRRVFVESELPLQKFSNFLSYERRRHHRMLHEEAYQQRMRFINARIDSNDNNKDE